MNRSRALAAIASMALITLLMVTSPAIGQGAARIDLVAQTTFVGDDPAVIDIRAFGAPAGSVVSMRVHEAVTTRAELLDSVGGEPPTDVIGQWTEDLDSARVGAGDVISLQVPDDEIGELLRRPVDAGAHPLVIELISADTVLDSLVTHLLVVPPTDDPAVAARLTVALLLDLKVPLSISSDGTSTIDPVALDQAVELASTLAARVELPLTVQLSPETFEALAAGGPTASLDTLRTASVGNSVLLAPWIELDEEAWRQAGQVELIGDMYEKGRDALDTTARIRTGDVVVLDATATPATLSMLAAEPIGATGFVLDEAGVVSVPEGLSAPVVVVDDAGMRHRAVMPDGFLAELATGPDPELAVQHTLAELLRMALADVAGRTGVVVAIDVTDLLTLDLLLDGLDQPSPLVPGTVEDVLGLPFAELSPGRPIEARLIPEPPEDLAAHLVMRADIERRLDAYESLVGDNDVLSEPLRTILLASAALTTVEPRDDYLRFVGQQVDSNLTGVELVDSGRITITSRRAELPIVIRNDQTLPISVVVALSAEKIDFPGGDRQPMMLEPGENSISLEVVALASGDSAINLTIETPEGGIELATGVVRLRSTAISGLGLLISVIAIAVLLGWWIQTIRQRRRARREGTDSVAGRPDRPDRGRSDGPQAIEGIT